MLEKHCLRRGEFQLEQAADLLHDMHPERQALIETETGRTACCPGFLWTVPIKQPDVQRDCDTSHMLCRSIAKLLA